MTASAVFERITHRADFCVVGGGLAGLCAAVSAARHGAKVVLMQERPVLGGNASSEIRMWVSGAHGRNMRETGIIEELNLENHYRNPDKNYSVWDGILYDLAVKTPGLELLMNCSCMDCEMRENRIASVSGWQMTTQTVHIVTADYYADCSGDSILAPMTGAEYRVGREARSEFGESIAPEISDRKTMGMSCLLQAREEAHPSRFIAPDWAYSYKKEDLLPYRFPNMSQISENYWYIEVGGDLNSIRDTEACREELLKIAYGIWDYIKNDTENRERNQYWRLDWIGMLPGKRESRRYVGDHIMTQDELTSGGHFDDIVAYGGWSMDDHNPLGFKTKEPPTIYYHAPSPYGIPYRSLYSKNIENLFFAGRNISVTHAVSSSCRVMATCALLGQAVGTAAALAARDKISPRDVYAQDLEELQQTLLADDCYLPYKKRIISALTLNARLECAGEAMENLRNGLDRPIGEEDNGVTFPLGESITYYFDGIKKISNVRLVFDSDLNCETLPEYERLLPRNMICNRPLSLPDTYPPQTLVRSYQIFVQTKDRWEKAVNEENNYQRLRRHEIQQAVSAVRFLPLTSWGAPFCHMFSFDVS